MSPVDDTTPGQVPSGPAGDTPLISVQELAARIAVRRSGRGRPVLLDVRWSLTGPPGVVSYRRGHLPGATFVDLDAELAAMPGAGGRHPLPDASAFTAAARRHGVRQDGPVVVYDEADSTAAARAWWLLRYYGHRDVSVLDGGFRAWKAAGFVVSTEEVPPRVGDFEARPGGLPLIGADEAAGLAGSGLLLDARSAERFRGEHEPVDPVAGHIPGAVSAPTSANVGPDGRFLPVEALRERFEGLGVRDGSDVGVYCGSGVTACHEVLALGSAGIEAALYAGSWSHWIVDPTRPVADGP